MRKEKNETLTSRKCLLCNSTGATLLRPTFSKLIWTRDREITPDSRKQFQKLAVNVLSNMFILLLFCKFLSCFAPVPNTK